MILSLSIIDLRNYVLNQLNYFFPDNQLIKPNEIETVLNDVLDRLDYCFEKVNNKNYREHSQSIFNHLYSDQYLVFLWFLSNTIWKKSENKLLASKVYYLNKVLHSFDCMYDTGLPDIFFISHGIGTMLGKANYSDYFIAMQGCTVGTNDSIHYPVFGKGVALTAHSSVIGNCKVGNLVTISANTSIFKKDIPSKSLVFNSPLDGTTVIKESEFHFVHKVFNLPDLL